MGKEGNVNDKNYDNDNEFGNYAVIVDYDNFKAMKVKIMITKGDCQQCESEIGNALL